MLLRLTVRTEGTADRDVRITAPEGTCLAEVERALNPRSTTREAPGLWNADQPLLPSALLGGPGLRTGDIIHGGQAGERDPAAGAVLRLHVVGGPDAGRVIALSRGVSTIGRAPGCDLELRDPNVSRQHADITVTTAGLTVRDLDSTNGTRVERVDVDRDGSSLNPGSYVQVGDSALAVVAVDEPAAVLRDASDGTRLVNRPPRQSTFPVGGAVVLEDAARENTVHRIQWFAALLPVAAGGLLAVLMRNPEFLAFMLLSPVMMIGTNLGDRLHWRRRRRKDAARSGDRRRRSEAERVSRLAEEVALRRRAHPDPSAVLRTARTPDCRLWERRRNDDDSLDLRLGLGDRAALLAIRRGTQTESAGQLGQVPVTVNLRDGPLGISGPRGITLGLARWLVGQLTTLHSPADLELAVLLSDDAGPAWTWTRWLPHLGHRIAHTDQLRQAMVADLLSRLDERLESGTFPQRSGWTGKWIVLIVDRSGALAELTGLARVLATGCAVGVTAICVDDEQRRLPTACTTVARVSGETGSHLWIERANDPVGQVLPDTISDRVSLRWADSVARALAPLVDANTDASASIPDHSRLLDLVNLSDPTPETVLERWRAGGRPVATLGIGIDGPLVIDLVRDGPHTLVAGTTGAGKSELLQCLVAGLALNNAPSDLSFVLIDYKGGAAFAECAGLPHTVGLVTDLDAHLTARALRSLNAELRRRETRFAAAGARNLDAYRGSSEQRELSLGRLVLIVDEFAALAEDLPEFVQGLIAIAQRGRSLGVHLVLATQRPGGVVSPEIRANTTLRIALRVTDTSESADVIGSDVAAAIDKALPGRAFVRTGSTLTEIQTGRVSGPVSADSSTPSIEALDSWGWAREHFQPAGDESELARLVRTMREAAQSSDAEFPGRPWLPPLPAQLSVHELPAVANPATIPIGRLDLPAEQRQPPLVVELADGGPVLFAGGPRSGRSTALRTLAAVAAARLAPADLQIYVIDCAGGTLQRLADLPHCGAVVARDQPAAIGRLLARLTEEVERRQVLLADRMHSSVSEARSAGINLPHLLLLLDGWESFVAACDEHDAGQSVDQLYSLLSESAAAGLTIAITGGRASLSARLSGAVARKYVLRLADPSDYGLAGIPIRSVPSAMPPGRAVRAEDAQEVQFAVLSSDASAPAQWAAIAESVATQQPVHRPALAPLLIRIRSLPRRIQLAELTPPASLSTGQILAGVGGDGAEPVVLDLAAGDGRWLIAGPTRSGRTTALSLVLAQLVRQSMDSSGRSDDFDILVAAPNRSPLIEIARALDVQVVLPSSTAIPLEPTERRLLLLVDDVEHFLDTAVGDALTRFAQTTSARQAVVVVSGRSDELAVSYRGLAAEIRRSHTGILLQPTPGDGDLFGLRLPRTRALPLPGRGILIAAQPQLAQLARGAPALPIQLADPCGSTQTQPICG